MKISDEAAKIIKGRGDMLINAGAGTGKTTTLTLYSKYRPKAKILYIAFNRSVKQEAIKKFAEYGVANVNVQTAHSLAYKYLKIKRTTPGYSVEDIIKHVGLVHPNKTALYTMGKMVQDLLNLWCNSSEPEPDVSKLYLIYEKRLVNSFAEIALKALQKLANKMKYGQIKYTHDYYLKMFQLAKHRLPFTHILFDEGQDASPAMLDIFLSQDDATKVIVGDSSQSIYGFRYAINALDQVPFPAYTLSQSYRFNNTIARQANNILSWKRLIGTYTGTTVKINGIGGSQSVNSTCYLSRSNMNLLDRIIEITDTILPSQIYLEGGKDGYSFIKRNQTLQDLYSLYYRKHNNIKNPIIKGCHDISEAMEKAKQIGDVEMEQGCRLLLTHGSDLSKQIKRIKGLITNDRSRADLIFSTVHKAKGMEYDQVILNKDFVNYSDINYFANHYNSLTKKDIFAEKRRLELNEEINILYVAATRTKNILKA